MVVPVYNTPMRFFRQMVNSVGTTYRHWQLVLMDASDADHPAPGACARKLAAKDSRILYQKIENRGIAENTTAVLPPPPAMPSRCWTTTTCSIPTPSTSAPGH